MVSATDAKKQKKHRETEANLYRVEKKGKWLEQQLKAAQEEIACVSYFYILYSDFYINFLI